MNIQYPGLAFMQPILRDTRMNSDAYSMEILTARNIVASYIPILSGESQFLNLHDPECEDKEILITNHFIGFYSVVYVTVPQFS